MADSLALLMGGFAAALQPENLLFAFAGCFLGTLVGVLIMGKIMAPLAARFGARSDGEAGMKLAAFAPTGAWVGGMALIVPSIGGLLALVGALYTLYLFFDGAQFNNTA